MKVEIKVQSPDLKLEGQIKNVSKRALNLTQMELLRNLKIKSPVDTGRLRGSWHLQNTAMSDEVREVRTSTHYARWVNDGTRYITGRQFVEKSITQTKRRVSEFVIRANNEN